MGYRIFIGGRGSGKTTAIIEWLREDLRRVVWVRTAAERSLYVKAGIAARQIYSGPTEPRGWAEVACEMDVPGMGPEFITYWLAMAPR